MAPVSLVVVGAGQRGTGYANWVLRHPDRARVVAVAEPRAIRRERFTTAHGIAAFLSTGYLLGFDSEQLLAHVIVCADRATSGTLPMPFLDALDFNTPELVTKDNPPE